MCFSNDSAGPSGRGMLCFNRAVLKWDALLPSSISVKAAMRQLSILRLRELHILFMHTEERERSPFPPYCSVCLPELCPVFAAAGAVVVVGIGGLCDLVVSPVSVRHIGELFQFICVAVHIGFIRTAVQHPVDDGGHLGAGDGVVRTEAAIGVAGDPAILDRAYHIVHRTSRSRIHP